MSEAQIAELSATTSFGNGVECVRIDVGINTAPTATLQMGMKPHKEVSEPLASEILAEIRKHQQKRLSGLATPDVTIDVKDGMGGTYSMTGYLASPCLEISTANIGYQANILDAVSILDGLDLSIYNQAVDSFRQDEKPVDLPEPTGDVCKLILDITDILVSKFGSAITQEQDSIKQEIIQMQHAVNTASNGPLEVWKSILSNSKVQHDSWTDMISKNQNAGKHISEKVVTMLCAKSSGFWNIANTLMSAFQMFYRPDISGFGYGEFVNNKEKVENPDGNLDLHIVNLNVRDGSSRILQIGGVIMESGSAAESFRSDEKPGQKTRSCAGHYPEKIKPGYIHNEIPPIWLVDAKGVPVMGSEIDQKKNTPPSKDGPNLDLNEYSSRREEGVKHLEETETARGDVMSELCKYMFKDLQLVDSVISARIPIDLKIEVGKRKTIKLGDAGTVKGFISSVSHSIDLRQGKELDSYSQVTITHVEY